MSAVKTEKLTKYYGKSRGIIDLDLEIEQGKYRYRAWNHCGDVLYEYHCKYFREGGNFQVFHTVCVYGRFGHHCRNFT